MDGDGWEEAEMLKCQLKEVVRLLENIDKSTECRWNEWLLWKNQVLKELKQIIDDN